MNDNTNNYISSECKNYDYNKLSELDEELRKKIIDYVSRNGGHLASNLGVVELTVALHRVFDFPQDGHGFNSIFMILPLSLTYLHFCSYTLLSFDIHQN